jgi:CheY-like chemotaxis protein
MQIQIHSPLPGFVPLLPILAGNGKPLPTPGPAAVPPLTKPRAAAARRILIIEDNIDAADTLRDYLELNGHEVRVAYSGPDGIAAAAAFAPDIVLCDIGLPGQSGWEVARAIRGAPATSGARLIAITGYGTDEDRTRSAEAGFLAHLIKPVDLNVLDALLED